MTIRIPQCTPLRKSRAYAETQEFFSMSFESLGLLPELLRAISEQGYTEPTPIQLKALS